jgi:CRISPR-associated protein (TIGR02584 family)
MADILVITGGLAPQLVTETLFALGQRALVEGAGAFRASRVMIVGTSRSAAIFKAADLEAHIAALHEEWNLGEPPAVIPVVDDLPDIRDAADAEHFGTLITELIWSITRDPETRLHLSLAGGRKTMSAHARGAIDLYGRPQDKLSHVLVSPEVAETCPDFWYPTSVDLMLTARNGQDFNAKDAKVDLAELDYVSVRERLPKALLERPLSYDVVTQQARMVMGQRPPTLTLYPLRGTVVIPSAPPFNVPPAEMALLVVLAERAREACGGAGPAGHGPAHEGWLSDAMLRNPQDYPQNPVERLLDVYERLRGSMSSVEIPLHPRTRTFENRPRAEDTWRLRADKNVAFARTRRTHWKKRLDGMIANPHLRDLYYREVEDGVGPRYGLSLNSADIEIDWAERDVKPRRPKGARA